MLQESGPMSKGRELSNWKTWSGEFLANTRLSGNCADKGNNDLCMRHG